jgi:hypothetical protein
MKSDCPRTSRDHCHNPPASGRKAESRFRGRARGTTPTDPHHGTLPSDRVCGKRLVDGGMDKKGPPLHVEISRLLVELALPAQYETDDRGLKSAEAYPCVVDSLDRNRPGIRSSRINTLTAWDKQRRTGVGPASSGRP